ALTTDDGGLAVMGTKWFSGTSPYQFGLPSGSPRSYVGHLCTDRPIYRPVETISYKGVLRADDDASYSLPPKDGFRFTLRSARGQELVKEDVHPNDLASFAGAFALHDDRPRGDYSLAPELAPTHPVQA